MAQHELIMPKMGESIMEATILKWLKSEGDIVEVDEPILEIATDKVDSEVPSPVEGTISKIMFAENDVVEIGKVIAIIQTEGESAEPSPALKETATSTSNGTEEHQPQEKAPQPTPQPATAQVSTADFSSTERFYSPLVKTIAKKENISVAELESIPGTGLQGRVTKKDILAYLDDKAAGRVTAPQPTQQPATTTTQMAATPPPAPQPTPVNGADSGNVEIIEMDRMRQLIAQHMVNSKHTSPHVTSFVEADLTNIVNWRNKVKKDFQAKHGEKITYTPIFIQAIVKAIQDFPMINISVDGNKIIRKKNINVGMAVALPSGNLIVPVIHNADHLNLLGLTKKVNDLARRARENKLKPEEIQGGTYTLTNVGTFGNVLGTPIINQPQVAIMAAGAIRKKPAVVETEYGDLIAIRHMMFLSHAYDHRVVDGYLGGSFVRKVADYLEGFDINQTM